MIKVQYAGQPEVISHTRPQSNEEPDTNQQPQQMERQNSEEKKKEAEKTHGTKVSAYQGRLNNLD